jgi:ADP-heptose:LPS heptosyltransferase
LKEEKIFILRNNDLGDVLTTTLLPNVIKSNRPELKISVGIGSWALPLLQNNPDIDEVIACNAPWHNKQNCFYPASSPKTFLTGIFYVLFSKESNIITKNRFTHGIDVLGSRQGSWLLRRAKIRNRYGVKGYAGGYKWCQKFITYRDDRHVITSSLKFTEFLGINDSTEPRPRIYLTKKEIIEGQSFWSNTESKNQRLVIAPGGGFEEKCWGNINYSKLVTKLSQDNTNEIVIVGAREDSSRITSPDSKKIKNLCGKTSLRTTASIIKNADLIINNSSVSMHLAGTFGIPSITLLGEFYDSASLHQKQWGYPESIVLGKETSIGIGQIAKVDEVLTKVKVMMKF